MSGPNLWWVYNSDEGGFSTLPTGPMLVPALLFMAIASLFTGGGERVADLEKLAGSLAKTPEWQARYQRYEELIDKFVRTGNELSIAEMAEFKRLEDYLYNPFGY